MKKPTIIMFSLLTLLLLTLTACDADMLHASAPIRIKDPWLRGHPETQTGELYLLIANRGEVDDRLVEVSSEVAARIEIHDSPPGAESATIQEVAALDLPVESGVVLLPGGPHLKLIGLRHTAPGELVPITLTFQEAGEFSFYVEVH